VYGKSLVLVCFSVLLTLLLLLLLLLDALLVVGWRPGSVCDLTRTKYRAISTRLLFV
jgi:hypothetical protein